MSEQLYEYENQQPQMGAAAMDNSAPPAAVAAHFGARIEKMLSRVLRHGGVSEAVGEALAAGVPWAKIISVVLPMILSIFSGQPVDIQAVIAAILSLLQ